MTLLNGLRKLATRSHRGGDELKSSSLELAAALLEAAGRRENSAKLTGSIQKGADDVLKEWAESSAGLVAAIAKVLTTGLQPSNETEATTAQSAVVTAAERLVNQTRSSSESLADLARRLKSATDELRRQAGEVGSLSLAEQRERLRLADDLRKSESLKDQLSSLSTERGPVVERMRLLQERLRLAQASVEEQRKFEQQVRDSENAVTLAEASNKELEMMLEACENKLGMLKSEQADLPRRIEKTQKLIQQLDESPDREMFRRIQEIWKQLPLDHVEGGR